MPVALFTFAAAMPASAVPWSARPAEALSLPRIGVVGPPWTSGAVVVADDVVEVEVAPVVVVVVVVVVAVVVVVPVAGAGVVVPVAVTVVAVLVAVDVA